MMRVIPLTRNPFRKYESVVPTKSVYHLGESSTPTPTWVTDRIDQRANKDQDAAFEARALNRRTWYLALSAVLVVLLLLVSRLMFEA
ncbi:hypothetical protein Tco_1386463 [Tanacetum coccineum]